MTSTLAVQEGQSVLSQVPVGVAFSALRAAIAAPPSSESTETYTVPFSPALAAGGYALVGIGAAGAAVGALVLGGTALLCTLGCGDASRPVAVGGGLFLGGVGAALFIGLPMILVGNRPVPNVAPRVSVSSKGAQVGWTVPF